MERTEKRWQSWLWFFTRMGGLGPPRKLLRQLTEKFSEVQLIKVVMSSIAEGEEGDFINSKSPVWIRLT